METHYTPKIEEFHVGFEYEYQGDMDGKTHWFKENIPDGIELSDIVKDLHYNSEDVAGKIRVKSLDREDIESFDFEFKKTNGMSYWYEMEFCGNRLPESSYSFWKVFIRHDPKRNIIEIEAQTSNGEKDTFFEGTIKNKSKFKEILTDIGIIKQ